MIRQNQLNNYIRGGHVLIVVNAPITSTHRYFKLYLSRLVLTPIPIIKGVTYISSIDIRILNIYYLMATICRSSTG